MRVDGASDRWPSVSIVVPTRNRAIWLRDTLQALIGLDYPVDRLEIVVVDNASTDETPAVISLIQHQSRFPIKYYRKADEGPAAARNFGIARATGEIIGFTDSDCLVQPTWVRQAVRRMDEATAIVSGPVHPVIHPERVPGFFYHQTDHSRPNLIFPTANVFYRASVLKQLGGFNEQFGAYPWGTPIGGEDIDLAWRALRIGHRASWAEDAPVFHMASSMSAKSWFLDPIRFQLMPRMVACIPELRSELFARLFISRESAAFAIGVVGLLLACVGRRRSALFAVLPWFWLLRPMVDRDIWPPARWGRIPVKYGLMAVRHLIGGLTLIVASVRYRTPVL